MAGTTVSPCVLEFAGRLMDDGRAEARYGELRKQIEEGQRTFVFDLGRVPEVSSSGIGFLVMCLTTVERAGGQLSLAAPSAQVIQALELTRLNGVFPVFDSVRSALAIR